ncbi:MAG: 4-hydroxy-tetrahydrodipicolinate reductase [Gammaproteobacteria bacterium]|nr:4-hydroxy-tetrahydrodipicolinate reductase [Gammaproteobacteria bacterium]
MTTRIAVSGAAGRMGRTIIELLRERPALALGAAFEQSGSARLGEDAGRVAGGGALGVAITADPCAAADAFDVLVDFSHPDAVPANVEACRAAHRRLVVGTTGLGASQRAAIVAASAVIPVVFAPNMSIGVNLCFKLIEVAARAIGDSMDVEVIEAHHRNKIDAPSGTAMRMGEILAAALGRDLGACAVYGREGRTGVRERRTIGFETIRAGDIVGDHTVLFAGDGERIEITHRAGSRATFAAGALCAAEWLAAAPPGLYDMQDVLGLR